MNLEPDDRNLETLSLKELLDLGQSQKANLTFYKLAWNALDQLARENAGSDEVYQRSLTCLVSGFLAVLRPECLPQAVAAKNLLLHGKPF